MMNEQSAIKIDERYRSYGKPGFTIKLDEQGPAYSLPYRSAQSGYKYPVSGGLDSRTAGSDYLIFGKLDQKDFDLGPFAGKEADVIAKQWAFLKAKPPKRSVGGFFSRLAKAIISLPGDIVTSLINYELEIQLVEEVLDPYDVISESVYRLVMEALGPPMKYKSEILDKLFKAETTPNDDYIDPIEHVRASPIRYSLRHKVADLDAERGYLPHDIFIEIGNEPNAFPAIPPGLYAEYYGKYWEFIQAEINALNEARAEEDLERKRPPRPPVRARVMPGALLVMDGLPAKLLKYLRKGFSIKAEYRTADYFYVNAQTYTNVWEYWSIFAAAVDKQDRVVVGTETYKVMNSRGGRGVSPTTATRNIYQNTGLKNRVSVVNLHSYPYFGPHAEKVPYPKNTDVPADPFGMLEKFVPRDPVPSHAKEGASTNQAASYSPEALRYDKEIVKSQLAYLRLMSVLMARQLKSWDSNENARDIWLTEFGNLTSLKTPTESESDAALASLFVAPVFEVLHQGYLQFHDDSTASVKTFTNPDPTYAKYTRWYWFKHAGHDEKFDDLPKSLSIIDKIQKWHDILFWTNILTGYFIHITVEISDVPDGVEKILDDLVASWRNQVPVTALEEGSDLTAMGLEYMKKAGYPFDVTITEAVGAPDSFTETTGVSETAIETINK